MTDEQLMQQYARGDAPAFEIVYGRHKGALFRYFTRQCSDAGTAEELFQEVWMKLIRNRQSYQPRARFSTWLFTLAHHTLVDWYRRQSIRMTESLDDDEADEPVATTDWQPDNELQRKRLAKHIKQAVCELPAQQREVFLLHQEGGLTLAEIAEITDISKEAAKSRYRYAINKLRKALEVLR